MVVNKVCSQNNTVNIGICDVQKGHDASEQDFSSAHLLRISENRLTSLYIQLHFIIKVVGKSLVQSSYK